MRARTASLDLTQLGFNASVRRQAGPLELASVVLLLVSIALVSRTVAALMGTLPASCTTVPAMLAGGGVDGSEPEFEAEEPRDWPAATTGATAYDIPGAEPFSHDGELCSFDAFLRVYDIRDPALDTLAGIVRGADTARLDLAPQGRVPQSDPGLGWRTLPFLSRRARRSCSPCWTVCIGLRLPSRGSR